MGVMVAKFCILLWLEAWVGYTRSDRRTTLTKIVATILLMIGATTVALAGGPSFGGDAPEIDPGSIVTGLTLFSGALLLIRNRRKA